MSDKQQSLYLIANAHLDPVWLWEWEEGVGAALSTFRSAADLCEEFEGFVFNHNEALLYEWVEHYEPELFQRIRRLVREGRWHIMGGWYLQPDCNLPSGESIARQIERGRRYFDEKFGVRPTTAINFDPFGHSRGLVQLLARSGFDSYLICRPAPEFCELPGNELVWEGFDGSRVLVRRVPELYNTPLGKAREVLDARLAQARPEETRLYLWGVGNHGGGPSRKDIRELDAFAAESGAWEVRHSTPEDYFEHLRQRAEALPVWRDDLNRWAVGCYTSQIRIKQEHRALENELFATEKIAAAAALNGLAEYPAEALDEAERDLLVSQFHDILPGSSIEPVEAASLRQLGHGREILSRARTRCFFALCAGQASAGEGIYPILVYNPHPVEIETEIDCELQLADQNWSREFTSFRVRDESGQELPTQIEKEASNMPLDWRKRIVFRARLAPMRMNRFDAYPEMLDAKPMPTLQAEGSVLRFENNAIQVTISEATGRLTSYRVHGRDMLVGDGAGLELVADDEDSWATTETAFGSVAGRFEAMPPEEAARFAGIPERDSLPPVRVIEEGPVRTVIEALVRCGDSAACLHYRLPRKGTRLGIELRVDWRERDRALKFAFPLAFETRHYRGQTAYGTQLLPADGTETAFQQWCSAESAAGQAFAVLNNGIYAGDLRDGALRPTLLRAPAYSAHHVDDRRILPDDRLSPRIDQGIRTFSLWIDAGTAERPLAPLDKQALHLNQPAIPLSYFPPGTGERPLRPVMLESRHTALTALRRIPGEEAWLLRLFNPSEAGESVRVDWLEGQAQWELTVSAKAVQTWKVEGPPWAVTETNLLGETEYEPAKHALS